MHKFCPLGSEVVELKKDKHTKEEEKKKAVPPQLLFSLLPAAEARRLRRKQAPTIKPVIPSPRKRDEKSDDVLLGEISKIEDKLSEGKFYLQSHYKII